MNSKSWRLLSELNFYNLIKFAWEVMPIPSFLKRYFKNEIAVNLIFFNKNAMVMT